VPTPSLVNSSTSRDHRCDDGTPSASPSVPLDFSENSSATVPLRPSFGVAVDLGDAVPLETEDAGGGF
jgi:hypothetical protein